MMQKKYLYSSAADDKQNLERNNNDNGNDDNIVINKNSNFERGLLSNGGSGALRRNAIRVFEYLIAFNAYIKL